MSKIIDIALANKFVVILTAFLLVAAGVWAMFNLPVDAVPDVTNVQVQVMTTAPALAPEEMEQFITFPVETAMSGLPRVEEIRSVSQFGLSVVTVVFQEGTDIYWARQNVNERLLTARERIPAGFGTPVMGPITTGLGEIYQFEVRARKGYDYSLMQLREILDWIIAYQLRSVPGVIEVNTFGGELKTYEAQIDANRLLDYKIPIDRVFAALKQNNANEGGGYLITHGQEQRVVRGEGLIGNLDDIRKIVLETRGNGTPVFLRDVADVHFAPMLRQGAVTRDGRGEGVVGMVMLLTGENARVVVDRVKERISEIEKTLPEGVYLDTFYDRTELVRRTIHTLATNLVEGGILVILVLLLLLGSFRAGLIVALAVPLSMLGAFVGMVYAGLSGNLMSLGAIDFGLIVDGSVVMIENVVRRVAEHRREHMAAADCPSAVNPVPVAIVQDACREVARPVVFGVGIILLVYLPILSLRGMEGKMFRPMAMTVVFALLTSLVLALTLMPVLAALYLRTVSEKEPFLIHWVKRLYQPALRRAIAQPLPTLAITLTLFIGSIVVALGLGAVFIPKLDEGAIGMQAIRLPSVALEGSVQLTTQIEKSLLKFPEVETVVCKTGRPEIANDPMPVYLTDIYVGLTPRAQWRFHDKDELVDAMKKALTDEVPSNAFIFSQPIEIRVNELVAGVKSDIGISLYGDDLQVLAQKGEEIARVLEKVTGAEDVEVERTKGLPFVRVIPKRSQIARHGINVRDVLDAVACIGGKEVGQVFEGQRRFPLQVRFGPGWRADLEKIKQIRIADPQNRQIPLEELAYLKLEDGPAEISREAIRRRILITCNVRGRDIAGFVHDAKQKLERHVRLPSGYTIKWGGQFKNLEDASERLTIAVPVALFLIFAILHLTFNSLRLAALIFLNVPLAATGGILALWLRGLPFSISAGVGFIALFGVAVLNGVVLVTYIVELRRRGLGPVPAAFEGAMIRVRPVLMTALVASLGFIPMAISTSAGAEVQRPLATVVIGGLVTSSLLTLFVLPAIYRWFDPAGLKAAE
jgi:cobalt-zinc-cadmium resistance protein CzcA